MGLVHCVLYLFLFVIHWIWTSNIGMPGDSEQRVSFAVLSGGPRWPVRGRCGQNGLRALRSLQPQVEAVWQRDTGA